MTNPIVTEYNAATGQTVEREMTDDEIAANGWTEESEPKTT